MANGGEEAAAGEVAPVVPELTAKDVALMLGVTKNTVYLMAKANRIKHVRVETQVRFKREWVAEYVARNTFGPDAEGGAK